MIFNFKCIDLDSAGSAGLAKTTGFNPTDSAGRQLKLIAIIMRKNKRAASKGKTPNASTRLEARSSKSKSTLDLRTPVPTTHKQPVHHLVRESYYNQQVPGLDSFTTGSSFTLREDLASKSDLPKSPSMRNNLQKVINKKMEIPNKYDKSKLKGFRANRSKTSLVSEEKAKFIKGVPLPNAKQCPEGVLERIERSLERERHFRKIEIRNRSFQSRGKNRQNSGKKFERKNSATYLKSAKNNNKKTKPKDKNAKKQPIKAATPIQHQRRVEVKRLYLDLMSSICAELTLSRETYELAHYYFVNTMNMFLYEAAKLQILVLTCIILATKVDEGSVAKPLLRKILSMNEQTKQFMSLDNSRKDISTSISKCNRQEFLLRMNLHRKRPGNRIDCQLKKLPNLLASKDVYIPKKQELLDMEKTVCLNLQFRMTPKTLAYYVDFLTFRWDDFIVREWRQDEGRLCFRFPSETSKLLHLFQIVNLHMVYEEKVNPNCIILAAMYLLVRNELEEPKGKSEQSSNNPNHKLEVLRQKFKSSNFIYVDGTGTNFIFTRFLEQVGFKMQKIANYCHPMAKYFSEKFLEERPFRTPKTRSHEEAILMHEHYPKIYASLSPLVYEESGH